MSTLARFDTPAKLRDTTSSAKRKHWSSFVSETFTGLVGEFRQFYDPTQSDTPAGATVAPVVWAASPNKLRRAHPDAADRWRVADSSRTEQDEYCEWAVVKAGGKITQIVFTTEVPKYYDFLAQRAPDRLLALYQQLVSPAVTLKDLIVNGAYQRVNRWNPPKPSHGRIVHLTQENNTLGAALSLAAVATVQREQNGQPVTTKEALARCSGLGNPFRNSDPQIAAVINGAAGTGASVTLQDPIGLYIDRLVTSGMTAPDGADPASFWTIERGGPGHAVRASFSVPRERGYTVSEIGIAGQPIKFGAQVADRVRIRISAVVKPGNARPRRQPCRQ